MHRDQIFIIENCLFFCWNLNYCFKATLMLLRFHYNLYHSKKNKQIIPLRASFLLIIKAICASAVWKSGFRQKSKLEITFIFNKNQIVVWCTRIVSSDIHNPYKNKRHELYICGEIVSERKKEERSARKKWISFTFEKKTKVFFELIELRKQSSYCFGYAISAHGWKNA